MSKKKSSTKKSAIKKTSVKKPVSKSNRRSLKSSGHLMEIKTYAKLKKENAVLRKVNADLLKRITKSKSVSKKSKSPSKSVSKKSKSPSKSSSKITKALNNSVKGLSKSLSKSGKLFGKSLGEKIGTAIKNTRKQKSFTLRNAPIPKKKTLGAALNELDKPGMNEVVRKKLGLKENENLTFSMYGHKSTLFSDLSDLLKTLNGYRTIDRERNSRGKVAMEIFDELKIIGWKDTARKFSTDKRDEFKKFRAKRNATYERLAKKIAEQAKKIAEQAKKIAEQAKKNAAQKRRSKK
jgi:cell division septum initiation protein DivIVA